MLTSKEIIELAFAPGAGLRGRIESAKRKASGQFADGGRTLGGRTGHGLDPVTRQFIDDLAERGPVPSANHLHPNQVAGREHASSEPRDGLTPAEIVWLQRLPDEPSDVTFKDATALARLNASIDGQLHRGDKRLVESIWIPVRVRHDRLDAQAALANASKPVPVPPRSATVALAQAIQGEEPHLTEDEALERAKTMLQEEQAQLERLRERQITLAQSTIDSLAADELRRAETIHTPAVVS
jgi:hypothetical protein